MLQLRNTSPFVPAIFGLADQRGVEILVAVVKATFELAELPRIAEQQQPVTMVDEYSGDPAGSSLRYPSEVHLAKPGADVIVIADACAPRGQSVVELDVAVRVGDKSKRARVYGDRFWTQGPRAIQPSRPEPFVRIPLTYERAYGGRQLSSDSQQHLAEPRNPVGVGFIGAREAEEMLGQPTPNIDDPEQPLTWLGQTPAPVGFAAVAPMWQPRIAHVGTYDEKWRESQAPFLAIDFDARHFQAGSPGLIFDQALRGGEPVSLQGLDPDRSWRFALPCCRLELRATVAGAVHPMNPALDAVILEPSERRFTMTWRACLPVDRQLLRVDRVDVGLERLDGVGGDP
jgi:hypothetical protein